MNLSGSSLCLCFSSCQNRAWVGSSPAWSVCQFVFTRLTNTRRVARRTLTVWGPIHHMRMLETHECVSCHRTRNHSNSQMPGWRWSCIPPLPFAVRHTCADLTPSGSISSNIQQHSFRPSVTQRRMCASYPGPFVHPICLFDCVLMT